MVEVVGRANKSEVLETVVCLDVVDMVDMEALGDWAEVILPDDSV